MVHRDLQEMLKIPFKLEIFLLSCFPGELNKLLQELLLHRDGNNRLFLMKLNGYGRFWILLKQIYITIKTENRDKS